MASSAHSTPFSASVYWDVWIPRQGLIWRGIWRIQLWRDGAYAGPDFTCYSVEELARFVLAHYHPHPVHFTRYLHPGIAEAVSRRLMAAGVVCFCKLNEDISF